MYQLVTIYQLVTMHQLVTMYEPMYELAMVQPQQHGSSQATACQMTVSLLPIAGLFSLRGGNSNNVVSVLVVIYLNSILYLFAESIVVKSPIYANPGCILQEPSRSYKVNPLPGLAVDQASTTVMKLPSNIGHRLENICGLKGN